MPTAATLPGLDLILEAAAAAPTPHQCVAILRDATHPAVPRAPRAPACDLPDMPLILDAIAIAVSDTRLRPTAVRLFVELARRIRPGELWHGRIIDVATDVGIVAVRGGAVVHGGSTARTAQALLTQHGHIRRERPARRRGRQGWILPAVEVALPPGRRPPRQIPIPPSLIPAIAAAPLGVRDRIEQHARFGPAPAVDQGRPREVDTDRVVPVDTDRVVQSPAGAPVDTDRVVQSRGRAKSTRTVSYRAPPSRQSTQDVSTGANPAGPGIYARASDPDPDQQQQQPDHAAAAEGEDHQAAETGRVEGMLDGRTWSRPASSAASTASMDAGMASRPVSAAAGRRLRRPAAASRAGRP